MLNEIMFTMIIEYLPIKNKNTDFLNTWKKTTLWHKFKK